VSKINETRNSFYAFFKERERDMKKQQPLWALCLAMLFLVAGAAWAAEPPVSSEDTPAILASLDANHVTVLDDRAAAEVRGQDFLPYRYVLVKILGINALDGGAGIQWTWNPLGYRYGAFGGPGWSNTGAIPADAMDALFRTHDGLYSATDPDKLAADFWLREELRRLATANGGYWGLIYAPATLPTGLTTPIVQVSGISFIGNRIFFGWRPMPYTEYARREAVAALGIMVFGRSLVSSIHLQ
jgi:hypothetical protein